MPRLPFRAAVSAVVISLMACSSAATPKQGAPQIGPTPTPAPKAITTEVPAQADRAVWFAGTTVSLRGSLHVPSSGELFLLPELKAQQLQFDPGASLHCQVEADAGFKAAVQSAGGVQWGYAVSVLEDLSQPRILPGFTAPQPLAYAGTNAGAAAAPVVEIAEADIVGISDQAALYYTPGHGLVLVDLSTPTPKLGCAAQLPGQVKKFYLHDGQLVALIEDWNAGDAHHAYLFHLKIDGTTLSFVESVDLGNVSILDSRRFNDELVIYGQLRLPSDAQSSAANGGGYGGTAVYAGPYRPAPSHRSLQVFHLGDQLEARMHDTLLDTHASADYVYTTVAPTTPVGTEINRAESFGSNLYASDHYFVVTQAVARTIFDGWQTQSYQECTRSHTVMRTYQSCATQYEIRPNPDYTPPETPGGDRSCNGQTLSDCLQYVAKVSNPTIQVPVGIKCQDLQTSDWICDEYQTKQTQYPTTHVVNETKLFIYAYTTAGFVRLADEARDLDPALQNAAADASVASVSTGSAVHELLIPGSVQTLQFQNGYLYAIANQQLLTFAVNGSSLLQTSSVQGTSDTLQTSLFTSDKLYLSDYSPSYYNHDGSSVLRVFDLSNPAFPQQASVDRSLPGGHEVIIPVREGIFTIGAVDQFQNTGDAFLKLGLFSDPFTDEKSYLIVGTDLSHPASNVAQEKSYYFDGDNERLFLPYAGTDWSDAQHSISRVDVSSVSAGKLVTHGGIDLPETPERVRPIPGAADSMLTFAPDSIEWLTPSKSNWQASDVFAYYRPVALYRLDDTNRYAEVLRLGQKCKLRISAQDKLNQLEATQLSPAFDCFGGGMQAYGHDLIFTQTQGVRFDDDGSVQALTASEVAAIQSAIEHRVICVLEPQLVSTGIDYTAKQDLSHMQCYTPEDFQAAQSKAQQGAVNP